MNPLIPSAMDVIYTSIALIALVLMVGSLVSWVRRLPVLNTQQAIIGLAAIVLLPILGAALWFLITREPTAKKAHQTLDGPRT